MTLWGVRSGKFGERENLALEGGFAVVGWDELPDLSKLSDRDALRRLLFETYPNEKLRTISNWESQIWPFMRTMKSGDPIAMPLKSRSAFAIGRVNGPYRYIERAGAFLHTRPVEWVCEVPRSALAQDLQYSFGAFLTVFQVSRNDAEKRVDTVLAGKPDPALAVASLSLNAGASTPPPSGETNPESRVIERVVVSTINTPRP